MSAGHLLKITTYLCCLYVFVETVASSELEPKTTKILSRKRRYVAFPEGSSFTVAICTTIGVIGNPSYIYLSYALNWGVAYDLPNETWILSHANGFKNDGGIDVVVETKTKRQYRRDLYKKLEIAIDSFGYNGKECILKTLCESSKRFAGKGENMVERMLRTIFSLPSLKPFPREHREIHEYDSAFRTGSTNDCSKLYPKCNFSVLDFALGKYSLPYE